MKLWHPILLLSFVNVLTACASNPEAPTENTTTSRTQETKADKQGRSEQLRSPDSNTALTTEERQAMLALVREQREARDKQRAIEQRQTELAEQYQAAIEAEEMESIAMTERQQRAAIKRIETEQLVVKQRQHLIEQKARAKRWIKRNPTLAAPILSTVPLVQQPDEAVIPTQSVVQLGALKAQQTSQGLLVKLGNPFHSSTELNTHSQKILDALAAYLQQNQEYHVRLQGYSDQYGGEAYALGLSQRYAAAVRNALIQRGVASNRLQAQGYGAQSQRVDILLKQY